MYITEHIYQCISLSTYIYVYVHTWTHTYHQKNQKIFNWYLNSLVISGLKVIKALHPFSDSEKKSKGTVIYIKNHIIRHQKEWLLHPRATVWISIKSLIIERIKMKRCQSLVLSMSLYSIHTHATKDSLSNSDKWNIEVADPGSIQGMSCEKT